MRNRVFSNLWLYFAWIVFLIMTFTSLIIGSIALLIHRSDAPIGGPPGGGPSYVFLLFVLIFSVLIGSIISIVVGKKILRPITQLNEISKEVAQGNFNVKLPTQDRVKEVQDVFRNFNFMVQELSSIETLRNDFVVNVSHEFKTPIAAIEGYASLLQDQTLSETEREEYIDMILLSAKQLGSLSGNILSLSKLENQELLVNKVDFRLDEQIRQALLLCESGWMEKDLELDIELPKVIFHGNQELLMQVWINLIGNAIKFSQAQGEIKITLTEHSDEIIVTVSDTGIGMPESVQRHIFEKFYQGDNSRSSLGNGLGLPLVKRIITLSGGSIYVNSKEGQGSTFIVNLPRQKTHSYNMI